jgi:UDPglucose 6-dehydrogenase
VRICIVGTGYVGLVSGACFAEGGHHVTCIDSNEEKISILNRGELPIYEPDLADIAARAVRDGRLSFSSDLAPNAGDAQVIFIAVGTPPHPGDGHADLTSVYAVARELAPALQPGAVVVLKSTVPVGTCDEVERIIARQRGREDVRVASNPEFLRAGAAVQDFQQPDRVVIGGDSQTCAHVAGVYRLLLPPDTPIVLTSRRSAELIKYASNAFLATKIAYINEMADLCEKVGADIREVAGAMGLDERIGARFLEAGPGFGGSCFPKDTLALVKMAKDANSPMRIVESVFSTNERRKRTMARKIAQAVGAPLLGKTVALLGLSFKANTDDMREAPSLSVIRGLRDMGAEVRAYDPIVGNLDDMRDITRSPSCYDAARGADAVVVVTDWEEFRAIDLVRLKRAMRAPVVVDFRSIYRPDEMEQQGFRYHRVGASSPAVQPTAAHSAAVPRTRTSRSGRAGNGGSKTGLIHGYLDGAEERLAAAQRASNGR